MQTYYKLIFIISLSFFSFAIAAQSCNENEISLTINFDDYPDETTWKILNSNGVILFSGTGYDYYYYENYEYGYTNVNATYCLPNGCYDFVIDDYEGDGICCGYGTGNYTLVDNSGAILASGGQFGYSETTNFCLNSSVCPPTLSLNGPLTAGTYQADDSISSNGQVDNSSGGAVNFQAGANSGEFIELLSGFIADGAVAFEAINIQCDFTD